jgi:hypothetical protein
MSPDGSAARLVECDRHGPQPATFVCCHIVQTLQDGMPRGFHPGDDPGNPRPDAWCTACEEKVAATGGEWTDESETFAQVTLLCGACYDRARAMNA